MAGFGWGGAAGEAGDTLQAILLRRFAQKQAEEQMELARQAAARGETGQRLQERQLASSEAIRKSQQEDLAHERGFRRATTIASAALPDDAVDTSTAALLREHGFGGQVRETPKQGQFLGDDESGVPQYEVIPELRMRGGSQYLSARAAEQARAEQAELNRQAAAERARESNELRAAIAGAAQSGKAETTALRNDLLQTQVDAAKQKSDDKAKADKRSRDAARVTSGATVDVLKELADFDAQGKATLRPETANLFGVRNPLAQLIPGSKTATAKGALDRLRGRAIVDLLNEMKNQSATGATGFGALSGPELTLLQNAASELNSPNISDTRAAQELERIYRLAKQLYGDDAGAGQAAAAPDSGTVQKWGRDAQGRPVRLP